MHVSATLVTGIVELILTDKGSETSVVVTQVI